MIAIKSIYTPARGQKWHAKSERGITLIMVLIFMVTLSLIAAVGMRGVISGERVVANQFDKASAFQAAESAGREGVAVVAAAYKSVSDPGYAAFPTTSEVIPSPGLPLGGNALFWRTSSDLTKSTVCAATNDTTKRFNWTDGTDGGTVCSKAASSKYDNAEEPRYVIEKLPSVPSVTAPGKIDCWYRITSHATGKSKEADVILQVMYAPDSQNTIPGCK